MKSKLCCIFNTPSLYRELIYKRIDATYDCDWYFEDTDNNLAVFDTSQLSHVKCLHTYSIGPLYAVMGMLALLRKKEYKQYLMMGHSRNLSTLAFLLLKRLFHPGKRVYLWTHGFYGKETRLERVWKKLLLGSADSLLIYGDYSCNIMKEKYGFNCNNLFPIHNSLGYDEQLKLRQEIHSSGIYVKHFGNDNPVIIFIGRLTAVKRLDMLVRAVADLKEIGENYNLVFVGDGQEREGLEQMVKSLKVVERIWFFGACYDEKTNAELVYNADLCVAPGNIGLTSIHVLMFGCPAISHNDFVYQMPEFEAIKEGQTGSFFERDNQKSMEEAISKWFATNRTRREDVRLACYHEVDTYWNPNYQMSVLRKVIQ